MYTRLAAVADPHSGARTPFRRLAGYRGLRVNLPLFGGYVGSISYPCERGTHYVTSLPGRVRGVLGHTYETNDNGP